MKPSFNRLLRSVVSSYVYAQKWKSFTKWRLYVYLTCLFMTSYVLIIVLLRKPYFEKAFVCLKKINAIFKVYSYVNTTRYKPSFKKRYLLF